MWKLTSIADLETNPPEVNKNFVAQAMGLSTWYDQWKQQDMGGYTYTVDVVGSKGRSGGIHASEISNCPRKAVYTMTGTEARPGEKNVGMQRRFNLGHAVHAMLQKEFELMCSWMNQEKVVIDFKDEVAIHPKLQEVAEQWDLHSSCDGIFTFWHMGNPYLRVGLEIKTKSALEYEKLTSPEPMHFEQTCTYMAALDLPLMWTLYYNKSNSNYTNSEPPYLFKFDKHLWHTRLKPRFSSFHQHAQQNKLPDRVEGFYCSWCPYTWTCQPKNAQTRRHGASATLKNPGMLRIAR